MPRAARLDAPGVLHHVMARGIESRPVFLSDRDRQDLWDRLGELVPADGATVYAWSFLNNHLHLLLRSGRLGLSRFMRRLLTGYAVTFNRRHRRAGHLFQNRFKSIVVEEEPYLLQLVRYIHLNPLRAGLVGSIRSLEQYRWCGHRALLGLSSVPWQNTEYILRKFSLTTEQAREQYREFAADGIAEGRRPDLVGGGLIRSVGGRAELLKLGRGRERWAYDERVLGRSDFVVRLLEDYEQRRDEVRRRPSPDTELTLGRLIGGVAERLGLEEAELVGGGKRRSVIVGRNVVSYVAVRIHGLTLTRVARALRVSKQSVLRGVERGEDLLKGLAWDATDLPS